MLRLGFEVMKHLLLLLAVLTAFLSPFSAMQPMSSSTSEPWLRLLLPENIEPVEYFLTQFPDFYFEGSVFSGNVSIRFKVRNQTDSILVHIRELNVTESRLLDEHGNQLSLSDAFEYKTNEYWVVKTVNPLQTGTEATLKLRFEGSLNNSIVGFYKSTYVNDITGKTRFVCKIFYNPA